MVPDTVKDDIQHIRDAIEGTVDVNIASGGAGDGAIQDGANSAIEATVLDYNNSNPLAVRLTDTNGDYVSGGGGTEYTEDAAAAANPVGKASILIRTDTPATQVTTDGDNVAQRGTNYGAAYVQLVTSAGAYIDSVGGGTEYTEDVASANPQVGKAIMMERDDALSAVTPIEGDWIGLRGTAEGAVWTQDFNSDAVLSDTTAIKTAVEILDNTVSGNELQVDILTIAAGDNNIGNVDIASIAAGDNNIGNVDVVTLPALAAGTNNIGDVDVLSVIPGTGATNLGKAIDTATGGTDTGVLALATRDDALGALTPIEGDNVQLRTDANGALWTHDDALDAALSGSELQVDVVGALPAGTNAIGKLAANSGVDIGDVDITSIAAGDNNIGNVDIASITAGDNVIGRVKLSDGTDVADILDLTNSNPLTVAIVDGSGDQITSFGGGTQYTEDAAAAANPVGTAPILIRTDTPATQVTTDGDNVAQRGTNYGAAYVQLVTSAGAYIDSVGGGTQYAVDAALGATPTGTLAIAIRDDATSTLTPVEGDAIGLRVNARGALWVDLETKLDSTNDSITIYGSDDAGTTKRVIETDSGGAVAIQDGGNTITVDGTVTANLSATDNTVLDNIDADTSAIQTAVELIDDAVYVDDADWTADTSKHILSGAVTQVATTANTDGDVTPLTTNAFRELRTAIPESDLATATTAHVKKYYTSAGAATDGIIWSPAAGKRWYVTDIVINVSAACTVTLEDDLTGGDSAIAKFELAANSGWDHTFNTPWYSGEDAADLLITTTAGNVYVTVTGYEI